MASPSSSPNVEGWGGVVYAFARLFRLPVGILAALAGCATLYALDAATPAHHYFLTGTVLACMYAAACAINDYWDLDKDCVDHPERPLPSGQIPLLQAYWAAVGLFIVALIAAIPLGPFALLLVAICTVLLWHYSHLLTYSGIFGNAIVSLIVAMLILLGSLVAQRPLAMLYPAGFLFFYTFAKEIIWDIHDAEGDRQQNIVTIANWLGDRVAFRVAWGLLILLATSVAIALILLPMSHPAIFAAFSLMMLLSLAIALVRYQRQRSPEAYYAFISWERLSMILGIIGLLGAAPPS